MRKTTLSPYVIAILILTLAALLASCGSDDSAQTDPPPQTAVVDSLNTERVLFRQAADSLVARFMKELKGELTSALARSEAAGAIGVCGEVAPAIATSFNQGGWSIKRVSDRYRNPDNRPDTTQARFLREFADTSELAPVFLVDWQAHDEDSVQTFSYYEPIRLQPMCLKCHGDLQTLGPGVYEALRKHYPLDKATGYKDGDLRGMFVIEAEWPAGTQTAEMLVAGTLEPLVEDTTEVADTLVPAEDTVAAE